MKNRILNKQEDFFTNIDSEIKAYLLGFIAADGYVNKEGRLAVGVSITDKYLPKLLQKFISPDTNLMYKKYTKGAINRKEQVIFRVQSRLLCNDLIKYNIIPNKTIYEMTFKSLNQDMKKHFIRGYFDGDGSIYIAKDNSKVCLNFTNSTSNILKEIKEYFQDILNFKLEEKISVKKNKYYVLAIYNRKDIIKFFNEIYLNSNYYLDRKYQKFVYVNTVLNKENNKSLSV
jgi:hypothetical protein